MIIYFTIADFFFAGMGVFATKVCQNDMFLLHYIGDVITKMEGEKREK